MFIKSSLGKLIYTRSALLSIQHGIGAFVSERGIHAAKGLNTSSVVVGGGPEYNGI